VSDRGLLGRLREFDALVLTSLIWFLAKYLRYSFPPLFGTLQETYGVSNTVVGSAFTGLMLTYAAMQFPSGALADRLGGVKVITAGAVVAAAGALSMLVSLPFAALVGGMLLVGLGTGAHKTVAVGLLSRAYPARTGRALGVMDTFGSFGGVAAPAAVVALSAAVGWRSVFLLGGVVGLLLAAGFAYRVPKRLPDSTSGRSDEGGRDGERGVRRYLTLFADRRFSTFVAVSVLFSFTYNGVVAFLPLYLTDAAGVSQGFASLLYSGLFVVSLVQPITGDISDRTGKLTVIGATLALATAGLGGLLLASAPLALGAAVLVFGVGGHGFRPVRGSYLVSVIPGDATGGTLGIVRTLLMGVGAVAPAVVGFLSDRTDFRVAFGLLVAALVAAVVLTGALAIDRGGRAGEAEAGVD
jgi:MFS family permease